MATAQQRSSSSRRMADSTHRHSIGEVTILQYQNQAMTLHNTVGSSDKIQRSKQTNVGHAKHPFCAPAEPTAIAGLQAEAACATDVQFTAMMLGDANNQMLPPHEDSELTKDVNGLAAYLGVSPRNSPDTIMVFLVESPTNDEGRHPCITPMLEHAMWWYLNVPTLHWPIAWFTISALLPRHGPESSIHHAYFLHALNPILSVPGFFDHCATISEYVFNTAVGAPPLHGKQSWLVQHGIDKGSNAHCEVSEHATHCSSPHGPCKQFETFVQAGRP
ncbi:hypothetical protein B0H13DRAFT_1855600 [Mycena leptocephala]|nr:hypothetical protein B0H13DRAFT_1855600 [Mycena leptocephala]